ncbi:E3 ubiquitin-protein ligase CHFR [Carassius gibelio]|uniref:E3 ubiquitin-protein ligase CHFR n=1 Tax=Carassius gibelio TaxID=101364 RepID=UPI002279CB98|nr:E3 ubiquitin-protein ligase CHFR [Carassius gibelio]
MTARQGSGQAWGKLVNLNTSPGPEILLRNRECMVGRKKNCDLSFPANKLVSGKHCKITQDENSGQVWLQDMSTNGTVINISKVVKKQTHLLQNGDVIHFVYRKHEPEKNIAYVYQAIGPQESASQDTEVSESYGAFTPDANEALNVSDLHFKSMQRHDRNVSSDGRESGCPLPEPASAAVPTVQPRRRAQKRPMERSSEVKGQLLEVLQTRPVAPAPPPRSEDELFLLSLAPSLQSLPPQTKEFVKFQIHKLIYESSSALLNLEQLELKQ